jgi:hypothetical protein
MRRFFCRAAHGGRRVGIAVAVSLLAGLTSVAATVPSAPSANAASTSGYYLVGTDGGIFSFGKAAFMGSTGAVKLNQPIVGMAATPDGKGYWMVASDGGIFAFGNAGFYGSMGGKPLNQPIVGMASSRTGRGYWLVASDGGIFAFGDAGFFGSTGNVKLNKPIVDIFPTPSGRGYWMAASDGGIFAFGDAGFFGSTGAVKLVKRIQQMAATPSGKGYWLVAGDGGLFAFGDAGFYGSAADGGPEKRVVDMASSASGNGYYITASNGAVYSYGDATNYGGLEKEKLAHGIIAMVALNAGEGPVAVDDVLEIDEDGGGTVDVLANDRDPDGTPLSIQSVSASAKKATVSANGGLISYKPAPDSNGTDTFTYTVADAQGNTAVGTVTVRIHAIDDLPRTVDDSVTVPLGQSVTVNVLGNDTGLGDGIKLLQVVAPGPRNGTATVSADGRTITYTGNKRGQDSLRYRVYDNGDDNAEAILKITVVGADLQPHAVDATKECRTDCELDVLTEGTTLGDNGQIRLIDPNQAGVSLSGTKISFNGGGGNFGTVGIRYQVVDDNNSTPPEQVSEGTVTFTFRNRAPIAQSGTDTLGAGIPRDYQLSGVDPDGDPFTYVFDGVEAGGPAVSIEGTIMHVGAASPGTWTIRFRAIDAHGAPSDTATLVITVQ